VSLAREVNHRFGEKTKKVEEPEGSIAMELGGHPVRRHLPRQLSGDRLGRRVRGDDAKVTSRDADRWTRKAR